MTTVMVFGTFDLLHEGHKHLFREARAHGNRVVAIVARDATVSDVKKHPTRYSEPERLAAVVGTGLVDFARLGNHGDVYSVIEEEQPDVICLGYDQTHFVDKLPAELAARGLSPLIVRASSHRPDELKSSLLKTAKHTYTAIPEKSV